MYKTIDLCAGIGGIRRGFELAGNFQNVLSAEIDSTACLIYEKLFKENPYNDVTDEKFKRHVKDIDYDICLAGFPCQAFSRAGKKEGFKSDISGNIFNHIVDILQVSKPKVVFLENVDHLLNHNEGKTINYILDKLINELNYNIVGVKKDIDGNLIFSKKTLVRNSKNFGVPQNRPRVYLMGFRSDLISYKQVEKLNLPEASNEVIYNDLRSVLLPTVDDKYFMASGYLETLEKHKIRQKDNGNGFGYKIVNSPETTKPIANTLLATGGSGKERNLILDYKDNVAGKVVKGKKTPLNSKNIRTMTPEEWGRLQGFINYAFVNDGVDCFQFPEKIKDATKYKVFGNSVTIPAIKTLASYMKNILDTYLI